MEIKEMRPSYVRFLTKAVEDRQASLSTGHYVTRDEDWAVITPHGSKDQIERNVADWFKYLDQQVLDERLPPEYVERYKLAYERFKKGQAEPLQGTAIKGWPVASPAQQANLIALNVLTVEDLADANEECCARIGLGARALKDKARAWLQASEDKGKIVEQVSALSILVDQLKSRLESVDKRNEALVAENERLKEPKKVAA
jgi:hypothetical protein